MMSTLNNLDILAYVEKTGLPHFTGVFTRDNLPAKNSQSNIECAIVNLDTSQGVGTHWTCFYRDKNRKVYFDSFGQITPIEIQKYLKTEKEFRENIPIIQRNTDIVQSINTAICGHLCIMVLEGLTRGYTFQDIIDLLRERHHHGYT